MPYNPKDVESMYLNKLRMIKVIKKKDSHPWFTLEVEGFPTIATKLAMNHKEDIGDELVSKMSRQLKITPKIFRGLMDCHIQKDQYISIIQRNNN